MIRRQPKRQNSLLHGSVFYQREINTAEGASVGVGQSCVTEPTTPPDGHPLVRDLCGLSQHLKLTNNCCNSGENSERPLMLIKVYELLYNRMRIADDFLCRAVNAERRCWSHAFWVHAVTCRVRHTATSSLFPRIAQAQC
ncbi:hypothetical protein DPEC_G00272460 [Dallia pectoralis]|uniref:Uncharacterized protein n=1 Tax=Dallia pectoralis TaxID=75939 RepID=A0ACC2FQB7_DALPE|nr:hypothetical protein DPEC_G00272460 [Dallia pectoralis]